jgi:sec-independent protein translocase protein TatA
MTELVVILIIVLLIFGAGKLPEIGQGLGKAIKGFKAGMSEGAAEAKKEADKTEKKD